MRNHGRKWIGLVTSIVVNGSKREPSHDVVDSIQVQLFNQEVCVEKEAKVCKGCEREGSL